MPQRQPDESPESHRAIGRVKGMARNTTTNNPMMSDPDLLCIDASFVLRLYQSKSV
jgi:hypothetical protein